MKNLFKTFYLKLIYILYRWCKKYVSKDSYFNQYIIDDKTYCQTMYKIVGNTQKTIRIEPVKIKQLVYYVDLETNSKRVYYVNENLNTLPDTQIMLETTLLKLDNYDDWFEYEQDAKLAVIEKLYQGFEINQQSFLDKLKTL